MAEKEFISVQLEKELIEQINAALDGKDLTRSQWLRSAIRNQLMNIVSIGTLPRPADAVAVPVVTVEVAK